MGKKKSKNGGKNGGKKGNGKKDEDATGSSVDTLGKPQAVSSGIAGAAAGPKEDEALAIGRKIKETESKLTSKRGSNPPNTAQGEKLLKKFIKGLELELAKLKEKYSDLTGGEYVDAILKSKDEETSLHVAVEEGRADDVRALLDGNADVNEVKDDGATPLYVAAEKGQKEVVEQLIAASAEVNKPANNGATPLLIAAQEGQKKVVEQLIAAKAEVNKPANNGATPLHVAAEEGHVEIVKQLIAARAEVDKRMNNDTTPLYVAAEKGQKEVVEQLIAAKAEVDPVRKEDGATPLHVAAKEGNTKVIDLLIAARAEVDKRMNNDTTPLHVAAQKGQAEVVEQLIAAKAEVDPVRKEDGATPLHIAAQENHLKTVRALLDRNADVNKESNGNTTSLYLAAQNGHINVVRALIDRNADVNKELDNGIAPLYIAARIGHAEVVRALLNGNADVNKATYGETPLHIAAQEGHAETVCALFDGNADVNLKDDDGITALEIIAKREDLLDENIFRLMLSKANIETLEKVQSLVVGNEVKSRIVDEYVRVTKTISNALVMNIGGEGGSAKGGPGNDLDGEDDFFARMGKEFLANDEGAAQIRFQEKAFEAYGEQHGSGGGAPAPPISAPDPAESSEDKDLEKALAASIKSYQTENQAQQQDSSTAGLTPRDIRRMIRSSNTGALQKNIDNENIKITDPIDELSMAYVAAQHGSVEVLDLLLGQEVNLDDENGSKNKKHTPLCVAAACGKIEAVNFLIDNGARVNGCESDLTKAGGRSPLYAAVRNGHRGVVQKLLAAGADVNVTNKKGNSLLRAAFEAEAKDYVGVIIDLILHAKNSKNVDLMKLSSAAELEITGQQHFTVENSKETRKSGKARLKIMLEYVFENFKEQRDGFFAAVTELNPEIVADIAGLWDNLSECEASRTDSAVTVDYDDWAQSGSGLDVGSGNISTYPFNSDENPNAGEAPPPSRSTARRVPLTAVQSPKSERKSRSTDSVGGDSSTPPR